MLNSNLKHYEYCWCFEGYLSPSTVVKNSKNSRLFKYFWMFHSFCCFSVFSLTYIQVKNLRFVIWSLILTSSANENLMIRVTPLQGLLITVRIRSLHKLKLVKVVWFQARANVCYSPSCLKKYFLHQKWSKVTWK